MQCLECKQELAVINNTHLVDCCNLTLQEYALRHGLSLDILVAAEDLNQRDMITNYPQCQEIARDVEIILTALDVAAVLDYDADFAILVGEIRRLDQLLWFLKSLQGHGFRFRQEYIYNDTTHRVVALNRLKARRENLTAFKHSDCHQLNEAELILLTSILVAMNSLFLNGYLFLEISNAKFAEAIQKRLTITFGIQFKQLFSISEKTMFLRTLTVNDANSLLEILKPTLTEIPCTKERYFDIQEKALVAKEMVFDSAHFITDHPDKCANLHGGRYNLLIKVYDRIDPYTGFVVDYAYLKSIVKLRVIEQLDHQHLNMADVSLSWRSSTELINMFIWEQLIDYLPNLYELQTYETAQSYCIYQGPSLDEIQKRGGRITESYFQSKELGRCALRDLLKH